MKSSKLSILLKGLILENPVLVLVLGTCPTLAQTGSVIAAFSMGSAATVVLVCSNMVISALLSKDIWMAMMSLILWHPKYLRISRNCAKLQEKI